MKKLLVLVIIGILMFVTVWGWRSKTEKTTKPRVQIPELPFKKEDAKIIKEEKVGNVLTVTYEYNGSKYQEEKVVFTEFSEKEEKEQSLIHIMEDSIVSLSLNTTNTYQTARNLTLIRQQFDWNNPAIPTSWKNAADWIGNQSFMLKNKIYEEIQNDDPNVIGTILQSKLPFEVPPMADYIVRTNDNGMYDEIRSIETNRVSLTQQ